MASEGIEAVTSKDFGNATGLRVNATPILSNMIEFENSSRIQMPNSTMDEVSNQTMTPPGMVLRLASICVPIFFGIIIIVGIVGNSLVITVMTKMNRSHGQGLNNTNRFILNLALADMLFLIFCVPFHATVYTLDHWVFGEFLCVFTRICQEMTTIASVYTLVALSVDRFLAVVFATSARQMRTKANAIRGLIFIWITAIGVASPTVYTRAYMEYNNIGLCLPSPVRWRIWYEFALFLLGYVIPLVFIIGCYMALLLVMCRNAKKSAIANSTSGGEARRRVARIVILVIITFAICWLPYHVMNLLLNHGNFQFNSVSLAIRIASHCMAYANSCLNPLIYTFVSKKFRTDFKKAFTCQYISDAVYNVKEFSQRMMVSIGGTFREARNSARRSIVSEHDGAMDVANTAGAKDEARTKKSSAMCPRSPLMYSSIPETLRQVESSKEENKNLINGECDARESMQLDHNVTQSTYVVESTVIAELATARPGEESQDYAAEKL